MAPRDLVPLLVYVEPDVKAALEEIARQDDRSVSYTARTLLSPFVLMEKRKRDQGVRRVDLPPR